MKFQAFLNPTFYLMYEKFWVFILLLSNLACAQIHKAGSEEVARTHNQLRRAGLVTLMLVIFVGFSSAKGQEPLDILRITPGGGDVSNVSEIVIQFNGDVVPLGQMTRQASQIPVVITPKVACNWVWINRTALSCKIDAKYPLKPATRYSVAVDRSITEEAGQMLTTDFRHEFETVRPSVSYTYIAGWMSPTKPKIRVYFNIAVYEGSVKDTLAFVKKDDPKGLPIGVKVTSASDGEDDSDKGTRWDVQPVRELDPDAEYVLRQLSGIQATEGELKGFYKVSLIEFATFAEPELYGVECDSDGNKAILWNANSYVDGSCDPLKSIRLVFNVPMDIPTVKRNVEFSPRLPGLPIGENGKRNGTEVSDDETGSEKKEEDPIVHYGMHKKDRTYAVYYEQHKEALKQYEVSYLPGTDAVRSANEMPQDEQNDFIFDVFGRPLAKPFELHFFTKNRSSDVLLPNEYALLEQHVDSEVPLYLTNVESFDMSYQLLKATGDVGHHKTTVLAPDVRNLSYALPLNIRKLLDGQTGVVSGVLSNFVSSLGEENAWEIPFWSQVTPYQIQLKMGHFRSIAWVVDMQTGEPVANAQVSISSDHGLFSLGADEEPLARALTDAEGVAILPGTEQLNPAADNGGYYEVEKGSFRLEVRKDGNLAVLPVRSQFFQYPQWANDQYHPYEYSARSQYSHMKAWGTTAQGIYRAGETIQYKIYVRDQDVNTLTPAKLGFYALIVEDPMGIEVFKEVNVGLNEFGAFDGEVDLSKQAALGWYRFKLYGSEVAFEEDVQSNDPELRDSPFYAVPLTVLVNDFTLSPFKVTAEVDTKMAMANEPISVHTMAELHSGGPYINAPLYLNAVIKPETLIFENPLLKGYYFDGQESARPFTVYDADGRIDERGENVVQFSIKPQELGYGRLEIEAVVGDDQGRRIADKTSLPYRDLGRYVGLKIDGWVFEAGKVLDVPFVVSDRSGNILEDVPVNISIQQYFLKTVRVMGAGNAYENEYVEEWVTKDRCENIKSKSDGSMCALTPPVAGYYRIKAEVSDDMGKVHQAQSHIYVTGSDYVLWREPTGEMLDIVALDSEYKVGDIARFLIKNPFPGAKALVTIERNGVIDHEVRTLDGSTPVLEVQIKPDYLPGVFMSVVLFSPRVEKPLKEGVDLGKPTLRSGYATINVSDPYKEISVSATADNETYKPGDTVHIDLKASTQNSNKGNEQVEFAVVVIDEAVFNLLNDGRGLYDPVEGFGQLESLDVQNYSLMSILVGRQKFEEKGANPGGGGEAMQASAPGENYRELFQNMAYWNPSIVADGEGKAEFSFKAPDNLTGWRVLVMAVTPTDRMGLGEGTFKVNQVTEIRPMMPNQVLPGDRFQAGFSINNRLDTFRKVEIWIETSGAIDTRGTPSKIFRQMELKPYERAQLFVPISVVSSLEGVDIQNIEFRISAKDITDTDAALFTLPVLEVETYVQSAEFGALLDAQTRIHVDLPADMEEHTAKINLSLSPSIVGNLQQAFTFARDYPYGCWEQQMTRALMAAIYLKMGGKAGTGVKWPDARNVVLAWLDNVKNYQSSSGGMAYYEPQDQYADPFLSVMTGLGLRWLQDWGWGRFLPNQQQEKLLGYLEEYLKGNIKSPFYDEARSASVQALAVAVLSLHGRAQEGDIERVTQNIWQLDSLSLSTFVSAIAANENASNTISFALTQLIKKLDILPRSVNLNQNITHDPFNRLLASVARDRCGVLSSLARLSNHTNYKNLVVDLPSRLAESVYSERNMGQSGWNTTQENLWCTKALLDYKERFESGKLDVQVDLDFAGQDLGGVQFTSFQDEAWQVSRSISKNEDAENSSIVFNRLGDAPVYYSAQLEYRQEENAQRAETAGLQLVKEYSVFRDGEWHLLGSGMDELQTGDLVRVDIFLNASNSSSFVVVEDQVVSGLEPVNRNLATASATALEQLELKPARGSTYYTQNDWQEYGESYYGFYFRELGHNRVRFYSEYLERGNYHLNYITQVISAGNFRVTQARAENMYNPEIFGTSEGGRMNIVSHLSE